jgi:exodeoxyribonuclease V gamma subunit
VPLFVHRSNRTELLVELLADVVAAPLSAALAPERIVVQGAGMERWLTGRLAARFGVWAQPCFPFPRAAAELVLDALLGPAPEGRERFEPARLTLQIAGALPALLTDPALARFRAYLEADDSGTRLVALASELAACFDRYAIYRPELLLAFERGDGDPAQGRLWCAISEGAREAHFAARVAALGRRDRHAPPVGELPERMTLFGLSALAPSLLDVFRAAAVHVPVHAFLLVPVSAYYDDIDRHERHRRDVSGLVAHLGRMIRELDHDLRALEGPEVGVIDALVEPEGSHMLAGLQRVMLELDPSPEKQPIPRSDDSVRVHACADKTRELEVLRDELRHRLERDSSLRPRDVVVLVPDVASYEHAIETVFGASDDGPPLPYRVADTSPLATSPAASALFGLVALVRGRVTLTELFDFLHTGPLRRRFQLSDDDLDTFESWLERAGARFGLGQRDAAGRPALHSLAFAIDRLLLGLALPDAARGAFADVVPAPSAEGKASETLGKLGRILRLLLTYSQALRTRRSIAEHAALLTRAQADLFGSGEDDPHAALIEQALARVAVDAEAAEAHAPVDARSVVSLLESALTGPGVATAFLSGEVVFCQHVPMRAIPFRVLCMVGMDESAFPRPARPEQLDLAAAAPRRGDRNARDDDRQLFLDALLSARDALVLSYVREAEGGSESRGPSSVIARLVRTLETHFEVAEPGALPGALGSVEALVVRSHTRRAYDARNFRPDAPIGFPSYDDAAARLARVASAPPRDPQNMLGRPLPVRTRARTLSLGELVRFWKHPHKAFATARLGLRLWSADDDARDREPIILSPLERYAAGERVLSGLGELANDTRSAIMERTGELPKGMIGKVQLSQLEHTGAALRGAAERGDDRLGPSAPPLRVSLTLRDQHTLVGQLDRMHARGRRLLTFGAMNGKRLIQAWLEHLALVQTLPGPSYTLLVARDQTSAGSAAFGEVTQASEHLAELIELYELGLDEPLPFFPDASLAYVQALGSGQDHEDALARAAKALGEGAQADHVRDDPYLSELLGRVSAERLGRLALRAEPRYDFAAVATAVFGPLLRAKTGGGDA